MDTKELGLWSGIAPHEVRNVVKGKDSVFPWETVATVSLANGAVFQAHGKDAEQIFRKWEEGAE